VITPLAHSRLKMFWPPGPEHADFQIGDPPLE
jgi:hypothetical protein